MRAFYLALICLPFLASCGGEKNDPNLIEEGMMMASDPLDTCLCETLTTDSLGQYWLDAKLFTGVCIYNYPNTNTKYMVKGIMDGKLHGKVTYYDQVGKVLVEEIYDEGVKKRTGDGAPLICDCSDLEQKKLPGEYMHRSILEDIPFTGKCTKKYPETNQTYMEANYKNGLLEGFTIYYDQAGNTLYMEKYDNGKLIKIIHQ